jgi:hypothetical protein
MSTIVNWLRRSLLLSLAAALLLGAVPVMTVAAQGANPPATPGAAQTLTDRLQRAWAREQALYTRIGDLLNRADGLVSRIQDKLDQAKANGKDVSSVQAALDGFSAALKEVHPIYASMGGIVSAHQGFDASGNVTDVDQAIGTVEALHAKFLEIRATGIRAAGQALRAAIQAYRQANPPATPTPSSSTSGTRG